MAVVKLPVGSSGTILANGAQISFSDYGNAGQEISSGAAASYAALAQRHITLYDTNDPDHVEAVGPPSAGRLIPRPDGSMTLDLTDVSATDDVTFTYDRTKDGSTVRVDATVSVGASPKKSGWGRGLHYYPEIDPANDAVVWECAEDARIVHVSETGITKAEAEAYYGRSLSNADLVSAQAPATGATSEPKFDTADGLLRLGETPALAVDLDIATRIQTQRGDMFRSDVYLFKNGDTFADLVGLGDNYGISALHPFVVTSYSDPADPSPILPAITAAGPKAPGGLNRNMLLQNLNIQGSFAIAAPSMLMVDNFRFTFEEPNNGYPLKAEGVAGMMQGITLRRLWFKDIVPTTSNGASFWGKANADRTSGTYITAANGLLVEKVFMDTIGWAPGYRADRSNAFPKSPEDRSHGFYQQGSSRDTTTRDMIILNPCHSVMQNRSGGVVERVFGAGANTGINLGNGIDGSTELGDIGNWGLLSDYVQTVAGYKDYQGNAQVIAGGIQVVSPNAALNRAIVAHAGVGKGPITTGLEIGPIGDTTAATRLFAINETSNDGFPYRGPTGTEYPTPDYKVYNWRNAPDVNIGGLTATLLNAATLSDWTDSRFATSGADVFETGAQLAALSAPWEELKPLLNYFLVPFGYAAIPSRTTGQTVRFQPDAEGRTPGRRADIRDDWSTKDFPGDAVGDSVDFGRYSVFWNITPKHRLVNLAWEAGAELHQTGGKIAPSGTLTVPAGGVPVRLSMGAKFEMAGYTGTNRITFELDESRLSNTGSMSGRVDILARRGSEVLLCRDGGSWAVGDGTIALYGDAVMGWDGTSGNAGSIVMSSGSTLRMKPTHRVDIDMSGVTPFVLGEESDAGVVTGRNIYYFAKPGATLTLANGTTGRVLRSERYQNNNMFVYLEDVSGPVVNGTTTSVQTTYEDLADGPVQSIGTVAGHTVLMPQVREFRSGLYGTAAPDIASSMTCAGTLEADVTGLAPGTYDLIAADTVSGTFATVTITGGSATVDYSTPGRVRLVV